MQKRLTSQQIEYIAQQARRELARRDLLDFTLYTFPTYEIGWHHRAYAKQLTAFAEGKIKNLMVFMPPQHGKSELSTRRLPAFILGQNPNCKIGVVAYNSTIATKFNKDIQRIIDTSEYNKIFPNTTLNKSILENISNNGAYLRNSEEFEIVNHKGSLVSVGVGGGLTSRQIDILIMDDLYKDAESAWSETIRQKVLDWYLTVAQTRLHNESQQLLVFTRWHEEDLAGYLLRTEPEKWQVVIFPAIKVGEPNDIDPRKEGEALWASKHSLEKLEGIKKANEVIFDSLYQQNPTPKEGLVISAGELKRFRKSQLQTEPDVVYSACDIADEGDDSLCHPIAYQYGSEVYIVDVNFTQEPIEITQPIVASTLDRHKVHKSIFESNNGGKGYALKVKELKRGRTDIQWRPTTMNKHTKILLKSGIIKEHYYFLVDEEQNAEYRRYFYELTHYPKNGKVKHDDAIDGTTLLVDVAERRSGVAIMR